MQGKSVNKSPEVFKVYDDGYVVRAMTSSDVPIVHQSFAEMGAISRHDLDVALRSFPRGRGFYIGEYEGVVVASCIRLPWGNGVYCGSYYYVHKDYRRRGFGTRLRDEVAYGHVLEANGKLCIDAVEGTVAEKNVSKFGYVPAFITRAYCREAKDFGIRYDGRIVQAKSIPLDDLISFDNKHFVSRDYPVRRKFLQEWINLPDGTAVVALNDLDEIVGFGQRHPTLVCQPNSHIVGPLYAKDVDTALVILQHLCQDVIGDIVHLNIWMPNEDWVKVIEGLGFKKVFDTIRMHPNGNPNEFKPTVYALTALDVCAF